MNFDMILSGIAGLLAGGAIGSFLTDRFNQGQLSAESADQQERLQRLYTEPDPMVGRASEPEAPQRQRGRPAKAQAETPAKRGPGRPRKVAA